MKYKQSDKGIHSNIGGEVVILNTETNNYYSLNEVGSYIWENLKEPIDLSGIVNKITKVYDIDNSQCEADVQEIIQALYEIHLIEIVRDN